MARHRRLQVALLAYVVAVAAPLFIVLIGPVDRNRGFWVEFGVALGFIGLAMLGLQSVLTARFGGFSASLGQDALLQFHRQAGLVAFGFVLAHPVVLLAANSSYWAFLDVRDNFLRAVFLIVVLIALPVIVVTSLWRDRLRLPYEWWRLGHGSLAVLIVLIGLVHITRVAHYLESGWKQAIWLIIGGASIGSVLYVRVLTPLRQRGQPYTVTSVEPVADRTWSLRVRPDDGEPPAFAAGQFHFLTIDRTPFSLEQHPFSIASSEEHRGEVEFAIKELGDFTSSVGEVTPGSRAFLQGPHGSLQLPADSVEGLMLVAGGIGISPLLSMVRTLHDRGSELPVRLIHANRELGHVAYRDELRQLSNDLDLEVVEVLDEPPADWQGERGPLDRPMLERLLPSDVTEWHHVICGPTMMMEVVEQTLEDLGVPLDRIESERFDIGAAGAIGQRATTIRRSVAGLGIVLLGAAALFAM